MDNDEWILRKRLEERAEEQRSPAEQSNDDDWVCRLAKRGEELQRMSGRFRRTDWDEFRKHAAIAAMQGLLNTCHDDVIREIQERTDESLSCVVARLAVRIADSLANELRKEEQYVL